MTKKTDYSDLTDEEFSNLCETLFKLNEDTWYGPWTKLYVGREFKEEVLKEFLNKQIEKR